MQRPLTHSLVRHSSRHKNSRARQKFLGRYVRTGPICEHLGLTSLSPRPARRRDRFLGKADAKRSSQTPIECFLQALSTQVRSDGRIEFFAQHRPASSSSNQSRTRERHRSHRDLESRREPPCERRRCAAHPQRCDEGYETSRRRRVTPIDSRKRLKCFENCFDHEPSSFAFSNSGKSRVLRSPL